jgi:hypothetical protein
MRPTQSRMVDQETWDLMIEDVSEGGTADPRDIAQLYLELLALSDESITDFAKAVLEAAQKPEQK